LGDWKTWLTGKVGARARWSGGIEINAESFRRGYLDDWYIELMVGI
jgi:hypothetical protein